MADAFNVLSKTKKVTLPPGWVERFSKKHPDRPFYFNEKTGESRWSNPLEEPDQDESGRKNKRKNVTSSEESDASSSTNAAGRLLSAIVRPKLKAKRSKNSNAEKVPVDTPTMQMYREKLAKRKAEMEAKKSSKSKKQNQTLTASKNSTSIQNQRRTRRSNSIMSSNDSISSQCSTVSNASSMGSKLKQVAIPMGKTPLKIANGTNQKVPKSKVIQKNIGVSKSNESDSETLSNTSNVESNLTINRRSLGKNTASDRLNKLRRSLESEKNDPPNKRLRGSPVMINNNNNDNESSSPEKKNRVHKSGTLEVNKTKHETSFEEDNVKYRILEKVETADSYCEEMEWEPIEEEKIMFEVRSVRFKLCERPPEIIENVSYNTIQSVDNSDGIHTLYVVIDTNVYLSNLSFVEEVRDSRSQIFGRPYIVVPWTVLQELDFIKDDKSHTRSPTLILKARKAVDFINKHFTTKHPRFLGQTPKEVEENKKKFMTECPDDEILQTCLQIKETSKLPILLSYDKNLCTKAMIHNIRTLSRNDPLDTFTLKPADTSEFLSNSLHSHIEEKSEFPSIAQKEAESVEDLMEEGKALIKAVLSEVIENDMKSLFGDRWKMHVAYRPPWTVTTVIKCVLKHWMAVINESFIRKTEPMLRDILSWITNIPTGGRKLNDVKFFLDKCNDVMQTLNNDKYPDLKPQILSKFDELRIQCLDKIEKVNEAKFKETVGCETDASEQERRANLAFKVLEDIYAYARDACGIAADGLGLQCSFSYNKMHPFLTSKMALQRQSDVAINVNKLLDLLRQVLLKHNEGILQHHNDRQIIDLYHALINFSSDLNFDELLQLDPLDIFCCIKLLKPKLLKGCEQLQELAIHFCRMANYQCT